MDGWPHGKKVEERFNYLTHINNLERKTLQRRKALVYGGPPPRAETSVKGSIGKFSVIDIEPSKLKNLEIWEL